MVAVVLLTTLITPLALRSAFNMKSEEDSEDAPGVALERNLSVATPEVPVTPAEEQAEPTEDLSKEPSYRTGLNHSGPLMSFPRAEAVSE